MVVDASAALGALLGSGPARMALSTGQLHAPHLIDSEVANALRRHVHSGAVGVAEGWAALETLRRLGLTRHPMTVVAERVWQLRDTMTAYDAAYVALAERLECELLTADARLARNHEVRCPVTVLAS